MDREEIIQFLKEADLGEVNDHQYHVNEHGRVVVNTCSYGPCYTPKQSEILKQLAAKIREKKA